MISLLFVYKQQHLKYFQDISTMTTLRLIFLLIICVICLNTSADNDYLISSNETSQTDTGINALDNWQAGVSVSENSIKQYGIDRCFAIEKISDKVFKRMYNKSYKADCTIPRSDLRYLKIIHRNLKGEILLGEMVCNKKIAKDLIAIFRQLFDASYPIERMVLIDNYDANDESSMSANNSSCFNYRYVAGTKTLSNHSKGRAVDINPLYNPYVKQQKSGGLDVSPDAGRPYSDRNKSFNYKIDHNDLCYKLFISHGFKWGGDWITVKDYQHFEK